MQPEIKGFPSGEEYKPDNFNGINAAEYLKLMCFSLSDITIFFISGTHQTHLAIKSLRKTFLNLRKSLREGGGFGWGRREWWG